MATRPIAGVIKKVSERVSHGYGDDPYYCEFTILADTGDFLPVRYGFPSTELAETVRDSLETGTPVEASLEHFDGHYEVRTLRIIATTNLREPFGFADLSGSDVEFMPAEKSALRAALKQAKSDIRERFHPTAAQMKQVGERIDDLDRQVDRIRKFDWTKLFVSCVVGISVDLGFGTTVPETLVNLFKNLVAGILDQRLLPQGPK